MRPTRGRKDRPCKMDLFETDHARWICSKALLRAAAAKADHARWFCLKVLLRTAAVFESPLEDSSRVCFTGLQRRAGLT